MSSKAFFSKLVIWLKSPEVFGSISKNIPGEWLLFEYYVDSNDELLNFKKDDLKKQGSCLKLEFKTDGSFIKDGQLPIDLFQNTKWKRWSVSKNFITLLHQENFRDNIEFQFAFEKGKLKLLKKDSFGKIEFFGFFERVPLTTKQ